MNRASLHVTRWIVAMITVTSMASTVARADDKSSKDVPPKGKDAAMQAAAAFYDGIRVEKLTNGLTVYLKPVKGAATVTTMVAYKVGSSDEMLDSTGLSHYLEHLMFKGTDKIKPGDIDRSTQRNAGQNNAYTTEDYTIYHFDFPADRWEVALEIEGDRMRNLRIDEKHEFEQEKGAVIQELKRNEDQPWDLEQKAILPLLFGKKAPYGHPVIGEADHVVAATAKIIKGHYDRWYYPNNASLIIVGGFDADKALVKVKKEFDSLPKGNLPDRNAIPDDKPKRPASFEMVSKFEVPRMLMGFTTCKVGDAEDPVLDVIQSVLTGGKTGRLYKRFVEGEEIANLVSAGNYSGRYPGWFAIQMELLPDQDRAKAEKELVEELDKLRKEPIKAEELNRAKQTLLTDLIFDRESVHGLADSIARGVSTNSLDYLKNQLPNLDKVSADDVQRVAKKFLDPEKRSVVWSVPPKGSGSGSGTGSGKGGSDRPSTLRRSGSRALDKEGSGGSDVSLKDTKRVVLDNGLVLLLYENHRLPLIVAQADVKHTRILEPEDKAGVASLVGSLLDEGSKQHSGEEIADMIESVGGTLSMSSDGGSVRALASHRSLALGLLLECLSQPKFDKEEFERQKTRLLSTVEESEHVPETKASMLFNELVYGKHPYGRPSNGRTKTIEKLTAKDCVDFHAKVFVPNNTLLAIAGDFDSKQVEAEVKKLTADWKKADITLPKLPAIDKPSEFTQKIVTMQDSVQLHFYMGHGGITRNNPDYFKLRVMDYVLGTGTGFTDRLSSRLRDREGLGYTVSANITNSAGEQPGTFACYIGTFPKNFDTVKKLFLEELNRIRDETPKDEEVKDVKSYLLGSLAFRMQTNSDIVSELLAVERLNLGFDYFDKYRKEIAAVTPADVQAVAKKYLDPKHMYLVAVGAIDKAGKPLIEETPK
jgi:zinc protease